MGHLALGIHIPSASSIAADVVRDLLGALARALDAGIVSVAAWAIGGLTHAATATTTVTLDTWFRGPWRAMVSVAAIVAVPLFFIAVLSVLLRGEGPAGLARVLGRLLAASVGAVLALAGVELLLALVDVACAVVEHVSGVSLAGALARLGTALGVTGAVAGPPATGIGAVILAVLAALGALVVWLELAVRSALVVVAVAFLPLGLAGLLWPATSSWLRRLAEVITAVAVSKLVIVVVLILGAAALSASPLSLDHPGADLDAMVSGVAFLAIATLGLPMALRLVPMATEAAVGAGLGAVFVRKALRAPTRVPAHVGAVSGVLRSVNGAASPASAAAGAAGDGTARATSAAAPAPTAGRPNAAGREWGSRPGTGGSDSSGGRQ